jgi:two-component system response regulator RegA
VTDSRRVLVVDDDPLARFAVSRALGDAGCDVTEAADADDAAHAVACARCPFDVVVLDYLMPDSADLACLTCIHALSPESRVIVMTAYSTSDMITDALRLGAASVLRKPIDIDELCRLVTP